ncbi:hypothetical protein GAP32_153 [Cronobacter phage vB_CsaM_GAP32]|uniref:Uncharacterized protein n=1 Tax=Cronobacter phage vB_CsaM_GAP32 TaxID=1141136 RepID=K4F6N0_9CAUD|nr:hypothetical protein GAP32_153 [Cronobacter phage vB_CsaM_GAP32]AFC21603.1 hypothetical protein GAP32_153 [Cronobacter phage vB_CsaM_GAP32]
MKSKPTREDVLSSVRQESDRINEEAKGMEVFDLTTPKELEPVLAKIHTYSELGKSGWYEVVYHNGTEWCCYAGSNTFNDGEKVLSWKYCKDVL